jgi:hypothetical protein
MMIARTWHGRVLAVKADAYYDYLQRTGLNDYLTTPGNMGVLVLRRIDGEVAHFTLTSFWDSIDAIQRFAGEASEVARYYPEDDEYLLEREPFVTHEELLMLVRRDNGDVIQR